MFKITVHEEPQRRTFQLEGRLVGRWVHELEECWRRVAVTDRKQVCVDLAGVTFVDAVGQACLAEIYQQGAELVAPDCLMKALVDEITQSPVAPNEI